jgi:hypothetical protein
VHSCPHDPLQCLPYGVHRVDARARYVSRCRKHKVMACTRSEFDSDFGARFALFAFVNSQLEPTVTTLDLVQPDGRWGQPGWLAWGAHSAVAVLTDVLVIACARLSRPQEWRADIASQLSHGTVQS